MDVETIGVVEFQRVAIGGLVRFPADGLVFAEVLAGDRCPYFFTASGILFVGQEPQQPAFGLLGVPGEGVTIDVETCFGGGVHVILHGGEVHVAVVVHAACHLHGVACDGL